MGHPSIRIAPGSLKRPQRHVAVLAAIAVDEFHATYAGPERSEYLPVLGAYMADCGGRFDPGSDRFVAVFDDRRIAIRF